jgi:hypothetical protein
MISHKVFIAHGLRKIREREVTIKVCGKTTWAICYDGKRHLLGSTAFYTRAAAERCKLAYLYKTAPLAQFPHWHPAGRLGSEAASQLGIYKHTGVLN